MMRRLIFLLMWLSLSGCTTYSLWSNPEHKEALIGFYGVDGGDTLLMIGQVHTYVFKEHHELKAALIASQHIPFSAQYSQFHIDENNEVTGTLVLTTQHLTKTTAPLLKRIGFVQNDNGQMMKVYPLSGQWYRTAGQPPMIRFQHRHSIQYRYRYGVVGFLKRAMFTPITVVIDVAAIAIIYALNRYPLHIQSSPKPKPLHH